MFQKFVQVSQLKKLNKILLTFTLSLIPLSLCINSVVERALSDNCWRLCDNSVWNKENNEKLKKTLTYMLQNVQVK